MDKNLDQENQEKKYHKDKVLQWLSWLAKQMSQSVFQIEEIQPQWLPSEKDKIIYPIVIGLILGVLLGLIAGIYFVYYYTVSQENKLIPEINILIKLIAIGMLSGLIPGVIVGLLPLRADRVIKWLISGTIFAISISFFDFFIYEQQIGILPIFMSALLGGAIFSSIDIEIKPVESIELDLKKLFYYATCFGIVGIFYALIHLYIDKFNPKNGYQYSVYEIIIFIVVGVVFGGFRLQNRINPKTAIPNQGIKKSVKYTVITFWFLHQKGRIPWNYAKFLNFASDRLLMKKVGGGYIFFHRMLLEHFARMNLN